MTPPAPADARKAYLFPASLRDAVANGECVAFVGAGFSMPCGMPNWTGLLLRLIEHADKHVTDSAKRRDLSSCKRAMRQGRLAGAAETLKRVINVGDLEPRIQSIFSSQVLRQAPEAVKKLMEIRQRNLVTAPWAGIVTTNFDDLIDDGLNRFANREPFRYMGNSPSLGHALSMPEKDGMFYVRLHGSTSHNEVVLTTTEYHRAYLNTSAIQSFLTAMMLRYRIVFVGCSLEDEILRLRMKLSFDFRKSLPTSYALLPDSKDNRARQHELRAEAQIEALLYPVGKSGFDGHSAVDWFLEKSASCGDLIVKDSSAANTTAGLRNVGIKDRFREIGEVNRQIVTVIFRLPDKQIEHAHLLNFNVVKQGESRKILFGLSTDEVVYRVLFLVAIGMFQEFKDAKGNRVYTLSKEAREWFEQRRPDAPRKGRKAK